MRKAVFYEIDQFLLENEDNNSYTVYNMLYWISTEVSPECKLALEKFNEVQERFPGFEPRDHPDKLVNFRFGALSSPITIDELLNTHPKEQIDFLITFDDDSSRNTGRSNLLSTVSKAIATSFEWSWQLVEELSYREEWSSDIWNAVIYGWQDSSLNEDQWIIILDFLQSQPDILIFGANIVGFLTNAMEKSDGGLPVFLLSRVENLSEHLWEQRNELVKEESDTIDWAERAIDHFGGKITKLWLYSISMRRKEKGDEWDFIPDYYKRNFHKVIG